MSRKILFKHDFKYDFFIEKIVDRLTSFIRYNPDDLNKRILEKIIKKAVSEISKYNIEDLEKKYASQAKICIYFDTENSAV